MYVQKQLISTKHLLKGSGHCSHGSTSLLKPVVLLRLQYSMQYLAIEQLCPKTGLYASSLLL